MEETLSKDQQFIKKLKDIVIANLQNENFGVRELARESGMSLYRLNRRLYSITNKTSNQFIREIRLKKAFDMLHDEAYTVAEVAYKTGFGSSNYFHKCFHGYYGYPPGKILKGDFIKNDQTDLIIAENRNKQKKASLINFILTFPGILFIAILSVIAVFLLYRMIQKNEWSDGLTSREGKISLAVLPFKNLTNDTLLDKWQEGIQISIINFLTSYDERLVSISVNELIKVNGLVDYSSLTPTLKKDLAKRLGVDVLISGSIIQSGSALNLNTLMINTKNGETIKSFEQEVPGGLEMIFHAIDTLRLQLKDFLVITKQKKSDPGTRLYFFDPITSAEAYGYMVSAKKAGYRADFNSAIKMYEQVIRIDSNIYDAYILIAEAYGNQGNWEECKKWLRRYNSKYEKLNMYNKLYADYFNALVFETPNEAIRYVNQMIALNDKAPYNYINLGDEYNKLFQYDKAIPQYERAFEIYKKWKVKPVYLIHYTELGKAYHYTGLFRKEERLYKRAERDFPQNTALIARQAILSLAEGDTMSSGKYIREYKLLLNNSWSEARLSNSVAVIYSRGGYPDIAERYYRAAHALEPQNITWMNNLGFFLIDERRNTDEGLELLDNALKIDPDNYLLLDSKGWGLFKKGRFVEARDVIQRSWDFRLQNARYDHAAFLRLSQVKKAASGQD